jgi:hypothetical protein
VFTVKCVFIHSGLELAAIDDHSSTTNLVTILGRFTVGEVVIQISKSADKIDTPYLMFRIDRVCMDVGITIYGLALQASLGGIQLADKIHLGEYCWMSLCPSCPPGVHYGLVVIPPRPPHPPRP